MTNDRQEARLRERAGRLLARAADVGATAFAQVPDGAAGANGNERREASAFDEVLSELTDTEARMIALEASFAADDALLWRVRTMLGSLYAKRYLRGGWAEADRQEGKRLLSAARAAGHLNAENGFDELLQLAVLLLPRDLAQAQFGSLTSLDVAFRFGMQVFTGGPVLNDLVGVRDLLQELVAARPADPRTRELESFAAMLEQVSRLVNGLAGGATMTTDDMVKPFRALMPDPTHPAAVMLDVLGRLGGRHGAQLTPEMLKQIQEIDEHRPDSTTMPPELAALLGIAVPGAIGTGELDTVIAQLVGFGDAAGRGLGAVGPADEGSDPDVRASGMAALVGLARALRSNDSGDLDRVLLSLRAAVAGRPSGETSWLTDTVFPAMLVVNSLVHGIRRDETQAADRLRAERPAPAYEGEPGGGLLAGGREGLRYAVGLPDAEDFEDGEDDASLEALVRELEEARAAAGPSDESSFMISLLLALYETQLAGRRRDAALVRSAIRHLDEAFDDSASAPMAVRTLMYPLWPPLLGLAALLERQPAELTDAVARARATLTTVPVYHDQYVGCRLGIALLLEVQSGLLEGASGAAALSEAIGELEQARAALTEFSSPVIAATVLGKLAELRGRRDDRALGDAGRAVDLALEALGFVERSALLQLGTGDALRSAKSAAGLGVQAAGWALSVGRVDDALGCLERGRALVLHAVATAETVPRRLREIGAEDLAEEWERRGPTGLAQQPDPATDGSVPLTVHSDLRRRALAALREADRSHQPSDASTPTCSQIASRLRDSGLDALVYLLPETAGASGRALVIRSDGGFRDHAFPSRPQSDPSPLETFLDTSAHRSAQRDLAPTSTWQDTLDDLCRWAGAAVIDPLIAELPRRPSPQRPARVVFVPCGSLGLVPWQGALLSGTAEGAVPDRPLRACDVLVVSYAASAVELLRSLDRDRQPYASDPVIVVDPSRSLRYAEAEAVAIQAAYLPRARLLGCVEGQPVEAAGTPGDVLDRFVGSAESEPASMLQVIAHGTAGNRPTASRLRLAGTDATPEADGVAPDYLTLPAILDAARPRDAARTAGLVVLDCCESDLTNRDHDEALTLTTAFVARGATDAIGSRWTIDDWSSAVCMVVFHHYLARENLAPADALRKAQRWMLGPDAVREAIPALDELLRHEHRPLDALAAWAPFIHQGNAQPLDVPAEL